MDHPTAYDYREYDRIWKRVSPELDPYPDIRAAQEAAQGGESAALTPAQERPAPLPGSEPNPCCMGTEAAESLAVVEGFIEEELSQRRQYLCLASQMPPAAARLLRTLAEEKLSAARELKTVYYLITGTCYRQAITIGGGQWGSPAQALRSAYHLEACNGFNYARAGEETIDTCLQKVFERLSRESFRRAEAVKELLGSFLK